jgi:DNA-binding PadR family transcriptional regulator
MGATWTSVLEFALLGLLARRPHSGYELRRQLVETPLKHFSDSPGSIYPALRRMRRKGLITPTRGGAASRRCKTLFRASPAGRKALRAWMTQPMTRVDIVWSLNEMKLRFALSEGILSRGEILHFLKEFEGNLHEHIGDLIVYHKLTAPGMSVTGRLALENGIDEFRANARWAGRARRRLELEKPDR